MRPLSPGCEASLERPQNGLKRCLRILAGHVSMLPTDVKLTFPRKNFYQQNNNRKPLTPPPSCPLLWHLRGSHNMTPRIPQDPQNAFLTASAIKLPIEATKKLFTKHAWHQHDTNVIWRVFFEKNFENYFLTESQRMLTSWLSSATTSLSNACFMPISPFLVDISPILCF